MCSKITEQLGQDSVDQKQRQVVIISLESFYKPLTEEEALLAKRGQYNFDHPGIFLQKNKRAVGMYHVHIVTWIFHNISVGVSCSLFLS